MEATYISGLEDSSRTRGSCQTTADNLSTEMATANTPLPPSVEKAYYRKCIELKRRLNEVEAANDELKVRRARQDRGVLKMRLQRAYLLDHLRVMLEHTSNVDGSDGSGDEGLNTVLSLYRLEIAYTDSQSSHLLTVRTATSAGVISRPHHLLCSHQEVHTHISLSRMHLHQSIASPRSRKLVGRR